MIALGAFAGLRAKEVALLQRDLFDRNDPPVLVVMEGKGGHQRIIPLHPLVARHVVGYAKRRLGWLFTDDHGQPVKPWWASQRVNAYFDDLGIAGTFHQCRHYFGTNIYAASRDLRVTQHLMGRAHPNTTVGYVAYSASDAHDAVAAMKVPGHRAVGQFD